MVKRDSILVEFIYCACNCGFTRPKFDLQGRERKYINNHDKKIENPPTKKERFAVYYKKEHVRLNKKATEWNKNNKEKRNKASREYRKRNPEKTRERHRIYRKNNPDKFVVYRERYKPRLREIQKTRYHNNKFRLLFIRRKSLNTFRERLFHLLGHVCVKCGYHDKRALQFDHINGHGSKELALYPSKDKYYKKYVNDPELAKRTFQVLCANCNIIKRFEKAEHHSKSIIF